MLQQGLESLLFYKKLCSSSFGPKSFRNLIVRADGQVEFTSNGATILKCLNSNHPVGTLITQSLLAFHSRYGDGTKTLLFLITNFIAEVLAILPKDPVMQQREKICLHKVLQSIKYSIIDEVLETLAVEDYELNPEPLRDSTSALLQRIMVSSLTGVLSRGTSTHLTGLLIKLVASNCSHEDQITNFFHMLCEPDDLIFIEGNAGLLWQSYEVEGVILHRQFHDLAHPDVPLNDLHFVLMSVEFDDEEADAIIRVTRDTNVAEILVWKSKLYTRLAEKWKAVGVSLVISSTKVPDQLALLLKRLNIFVVHFCPEEDLQRLGVLSKCQIETDLQDLLSNSNMGHCDYCALKQFKEKNFVHMAGLKNSQSREQISGHIVICAPSSGVCHQVIGELRNTCLLLKESLHNEMTAASCTASQKPCPVIRFLKGGGAFERAFFRTTSDRHSRIAREDYEALPLLKILTKAYVSVPLLLSKNEHKSSNQKQSLCDLLETNATLLPGSDKQDNDAMEPLCLKLGQWQHLVMLVSQLLRLENIIPAGGPLKLSEKPETGYS